MHRVALQVRCNKRAGGWWSPDGLNWTRDSLNGVGSGPSVQMNVVRIDDHTLLATEFVSSGMTLGRSH